MKKIQKIFFFKYIDGNISIGKVKNKKFFNDEFILKKNIEDVKLINCHREKAYLLIIKEKDMLHYFKLNDLRKINTLYEIINSNIIENEEMIDFKYPVINRKPLLENLRVSFFKKLNLIWEGKIIKDKSKILFFQDPQQNNKYYKEYQIQKFHILKSKKIS